MAVWKMTRKLVLVAIVSFCLGVAGCWLVMSLLYPTGPRFRITRDVETSAIGEQESPLVSPFRGTLREGAIYRHVRSKGNMDYVSFTCMVSSGSLPAEPFRE